jgi:hypothetical protein
MGSMGSGGSGGSGGFSGGGFDGEDEPPLLEELGINFDKIKERVSNAAILFCVFASLLFCAVCRLIVCIAFRHCLGCTSDVSSSRQEGRNGLATTRRRR